MDSNKNCKRKKSFTDALREKYAIELDDDVVDNLIIDICCSSRDSGSNTSAEFDYLRNVVLNKHDVGFAGIPSGGLATLCPNVVDLDLSSNLIESWNDVLVLLSQLPYLKFVNLSNNPISQHYNNRDDLRAWRGEMKLENLVLNATGVAWADVIALCRILPSLTELHLGNNCYECLHDEDLTPLYNLHYLHLHNNALHDWCEIWKLRHLPCLQSLILSGNPIEDLFYVDPDNVAEGMDIDDSPPDNSHIARFILNGIIHKVTSDESLDANDDHPSEGCVRARAHVNRQCQTDNSFVEFYESGVGRDVYSSNVRGFSEVDERSSYMTGDVSNECDEISSNERGDNYDFDYDNNNPCEVEVFCKNSSLSFDGGDAYNSGKMSNKLHRRKNRRNTGYKTTDGRIKQGDMRNRNNNCDDNVQSGRNNEPDEANTWNGAEQLRTRDNSTITTDAILENSEVLENFAGEIASASGVPFGCLKNLCLSNTGLSKWQQLIVMKLFPCLSSLKIMGIHLESNMTADLRRQLFIACLPTITVLNGGEISVSEREYCERLFVRYFADKMPQPSNMATLELKHGKLEPLLDIDLGRGYREWVNLKFVYLGAVVKRANIHITKPIANLRKFVAHQLAEQYGIKLFRMWHNACGADHDTDHDTDQIELTELFLDSLPMSRFDIMDGDEIHVEHL